MPKNKRETFHKGLYEVHLPVTDITRSINFYTEKLGFELALGDKNDSSVLLLYNKGGARWMLGLFEVDQINHRHPAEYHISFRVSEDNADQMVSFLHKQNIRPLHPPNVPNLGGQEMV